MPRFLRFLSSRIQTTEFTLFALVFLTCAYFSPGGGQNEAARFDTVRSVLEDHQLRVDRYAYNSADLITVNGHQYSSKAPGLSLIAVPIFGAVNVALMSQSMPVEFRYHVVCYLTTLLTVSLLSALMTVFLFRFLKGFGATEIESAVVALSISLGTLVFPFSVLFFSHCATAAIGFLAYHLLQRTTSAERFRKMKFILAAGFLLGFSIVMEYPAAIVSAPVAIYGIIRLIQIRKTKWLAAFLGMAIVGLAILPIYNQLSFGNPFFISYEAYKSPLNSAFSAQAQGLWGIQFEFLHVSSWIPFLKKVSNITISPLRGLIPLDPILALVPVGYFFAWKATRNSIRRHDVILSFVILLGFIAMDASYGNSIVYWGGGTSYGPRHVIPAIPFLAMPLWYAYRQLKTRFLYPVLMVFSVFFCLMATAIEPRAPYGPVNLITSYYLPQFMIGHFSITEIGIFSNLPIANGVVAFNWGELLGLPAALQLVPLFLLWTAFAFLLDRRLSTSTFLKPTFALALILTFMNLAPYFSF